MKKPVILTLVILFLCIAGTIPHILHPLVSGVTYNEGENEKEERESGANKQMNLWWWTRAYPDPTYINQKYWAACEYDRHMRDETYTRGQQGQQTQGGGWVALGPKT